MVCSLSLYFFKTCKTHFSLKEYIIKFECVTRASQPQKHIVKAKAKAKITTAPKAALQEGGQGEGSPHTSRSWPPPRFPAQVPPV
jgi:hypothetical protein